MRSSGRSKSSSTVSMPAPRWSVMRPARDRSRSNQVWSSTGRATYNLNPYENLVVEGGEELRLDYINRPHFYSEPRKVLVGLELEF